MVAQRIQEELSSFFGTYTFEHLCREWVWAAATSGELAWVPDEVGAFWRQQRGQGVQLDVVVANRAERQLLIGEAKWSRGTVGRRVLTDLVERSRRMPQVAQGWKVQYALFSRGGFSGAVAEAAEEIGARLVTLVELEDQLVAPNI